MSRALMMKRFARAMTRYEEAAGEQDKMAGHLTEMLSRNFHVFAPRILEFGCGTGKFSRRLLTTFAPIELVVNDVCPEAALFFTNVQQVRFLAGDAEKLGDHERGFDLVAANAVIQWFQDLPRFLKASRDRLNPNGLVAFSTFGPNTLHEVRAISGVGLTYPSKSEIQAQFEKTFDLCTVEESTDVVIFPDAMSVLRHLKHTGVTGIQPPGVWTRAKVNAWCEAYQRQFAVEDGVTLTYQPIYFIAKRRPS